MRSIYRYMFPGFCYCQDNCHCQSCMLNELNQPSQKSHMMLLHGAKPRGELLGSLGGQKAPTNELFGRIIIPFGGTPTFQRAYCILLGTNPNCASSEKTQYTRVGKTALMVTKIPLMSAC